jgi:fructokinase
VTAPTDLTVGVDLGGTKIEAVVVASRGSAAKEGEPKVLARLRVPTQREEGYEHVVAATARLVADTLAAAGLTEAPPVGVGMPGSVTFRLQDGSRSNVALVKNSNTTCLNGRPFRADFEAALRRQFPAIGEGAVVFANDANCFALAEATYGAARGARVAFGVILGTGVGGGVVFRAGGELRAWDGAQGIAGEWGHVVLDPASGPPCYCGRRGCVEQYLSGPAIERAYEHRAGVALSAADIASRATEDAHAKATIDEVVEVFGRSTATVIDVLDPDTLVLGGGVSNLDVFYGRGREAVARWVFNDELRTAIVKNELGDSAGVLGAALLPRSSANAY